MAKNNYNYSEFLQEQANGIDYYIPEFHTTINENALRNELAARHLMWQVSDTAFGATESDTIEVVDNNEKNWLVSFLQAHGFKSTDIHETPNMSHVDLVAYHPKNDTFYVFELKERDFPSQQYRNRYTNENYTLLDDEKLTYINQSLTKLPKWWNVVVNVVYFYSDGNVYFFRKDDYDPAKDRTISTERTHKKKQGSRRKVQMLAHFYNLDKPRFMVHDEQVRSFYN